jgi:hypothetical protein
MYVYVKEDVVLDNSAKNVYENWPLMRKYMIVILFVYSVFLRGTQCSYERCLLQ